MDVKPQRLLIIDDDEGIRRSLARILRAKGLEVELAADGESAVAVAQRFKPDCLLVDIRLPGMDGVATFAAIRRYFPKVPAVFMTAYAASEQARAAEELGAISVLAKPLDVANLTALTESCRRAPPVLIVDDDRDLLSSLQRALRSSGISVETAVSIRQALQCVRQRPDRVVIADVFLNDGFGYELLREMSRCPEGQLSRSAAVEPIATVPSAHPPYAMVLVTGRSEWLQQPPPEQLRESRLSCLSKPLDLEQLLGQIKSFQSLESPNYLSSTHVELPQ